jgi:hypothetical protein
MWIRIRIGDRFNGILGSGSRRAKITHRNRKKFINLIFLGSECSFLRAEGFL